MVPDDGLDFWLVYTPLGNIKSTWIIIAFPAVALWDAFSIVAAETVGVVVKST